MDHILYWNAVALEANRRDFSNAPGKDKAEPEQGGPTRSSRALAIIHLAMYDAHAGVANNPAAMPRYHTPPASPAAGANQAAAVAAAAHACLTALYPRQKAHFDEAHAKAGISGTGIALGHAFGLQVAAAMLDLRKDDPGAGDEGYAASVHAMAHRVDPANPSQGFHAPFYGARSSGFAITSRHALNPPPQQNTPQYDSALSEVLGKGIAPELMGTLPVGIAKRSADETLTGIYWAYDGPREIGTPPRLYNQIIRELAKTRNNTPDDNARLFAFVNAAMGDAGILAWDQKYIHDLWRPVLGIREHDASMGPAAPTPTASIAPNCDPNWLPLGAPSSNSSDRNFTPPFPAYPSGHATFGAAALHIARLFYGVPEGDRKDDTVFTSVFVSDELNGITRDNAGIIRPRHVRSFPRGLWQMIEENGYSRIFLGVHWSFDAFALDGKGKPDLSQDVGGVPLGLKIAEDIFKAGDGKAPVKSSVGART